MLTNFLLLKALRGEIVPRPPVWMMRQAGRYLPEYRELTKKYSFFTKVQTPELACEITLQPINRISPDAAILFSDILVVPMSMGIEVQMVEGTGPYLPKTVTTKKEIDALVSKDAFQNLQYVYDAIKLTKKELGDKTPLIGFAGAPFTLLCYLVEGKGSKAFEKAKQFCFVEKELAQNLLDKITLVTIDYLKAQVQAGVDAVQIFDSWSGLLSPEDFKIYSEPYLLKIADSLKDYCPVILFPKGSNYALGDLANSSASALGLDWTMNPKQARAITQNKITLQGNFDPTKLYLPPKQIQIEVKKMIHEFGKDRYIVNLGHGILPTVPVDNAIAFIDAVKEYAE